MAILSGYDRVNWTCEGLKLFLYQLVNFFFFLCELNLWGIETGIDEAQEVSEKAVWIEPVRDWNLARNLKSKKTITSVNWTCEGLKLEF